MLTQLNVAQIDRMKLTSASASLRSEALMQSKYFVDVHLLAWWYTFGFKWLHFALCITHKFCAKWTKKIFENCWYIQPTANACSHSSYFRIMIYKKWLCSFICAQLLPISTSNRKKKNICWDYAITYFHYFSSRYLRAINVSSWKLLFNIHSI